MSKILIADDNSQNLYLARFLLEQRGHVVAEAHDGNEAVEAFSKQGYDLVLMDIQMPELDGLEATRRIKEMGGKAPIIALTAKAMAGDEEKIRGAGCDGYINKPIEPTLFAKQVEKYLG